MNSSVSPISLVLILLLSEPLNFVHSQDAAAESGSERPEKAEPPVHSRGEAWDSLGDEQKQKLRAALRAVWADPAVINARDEVKSASESYQEAIRAAIAKADPSVANVLRKVDTMNKGKSQERLGGGPPIRMISRRGGDFPIGSPGFMERLSEDQKNRFREAERAARESDAVRQVKLDWEALNKEEETLRRKRMETLRKMRVVTLNEMVRIDSSLVDLREELVEAWKGEAGKRPKGGAPSGSPRKKP